MFAEKTKNQAGFTIVEVMIVLAIAGLVLAIVFIAVPALQRNSRNTQRRSDLANLRAQFDTWIANNGSKIPKATSVADGLNSIVNSTGWGHYNGNITAPAPAVMSRTVTTIAATCSPSTSWTDGNSDGLVQSGECASPGVFTAATMSTTAGDTPKHTIGYAVGLNPSGSPAFLYPDREEIHVFGEMKCSKTILTSGNNEDDNGTNTYDTSDLEASTARALAFVYQVEGEDNARCEDNI